jgi:hypothetical protein
MTAIHILRIPHVTATIKVFETEDLLDFSCRHHSDDAQELLHADETIWRWQDSVIDLYADDPRRREWHW